MESKKNASLKEKIAEVISGKIEGNAAWPYECVIAFFGEPKMPMELIMEDCED